MGETQLYSQRLHGITEKRRILSEVDQIQRELEQQRVKLHQLKRKSLRDRWLMDGLVPTAGAEMENPLSETEGQIKELELQLESLQSELLYLENPELRALKGAKVQGVTLQKELVNGERNLQQVDQNENLKEHPIAEEADQAGDSQGEKPAVPQKDLSSNTEEVSAPQCNDVLENHEGEHNLDLKLSNTNEADDKKIIPSQIEDGSVHIGGHNEVQDSGLNQEPQDGKGEHQGQEELSLGGDNIQNIPNQKLHSLENTLEQEEHNLGSPTSESESVGQKTDSQPSSEMEDLNNDLLKPNQNGKESLLDEITNYLGQQEEGGQHNQHGNKPHLSTEQLNNEENSQNLEENKVSVLVSHAQGHTPDEELVLSLESERAHPVLLDVQDEAEKPLAVCMEIETKDNLNEGSMLHSEDQTSTNAHSLVLPPRDQYTAPPCTDQVPSKSPGREQVQISEILVISPSGHEQSSSNSAPASRQPGTRETSSAPESQPLLQKPPETDANAAETRDKSSLTKKKTCQCCVVM